MGKESTCHTCVYAHWEAGLWMWSLWSGFPARPTCGNQPDSHGRMKECPHGGVCQNYRPRPATPKGETVEMISLGDGFYAYVDAADYEWLNQWTWHLQNGYAVRRQNNKVISMHRQITQAPKGMEVDHKNRNKLDNTRENLHVCTRAENAQNRRKPRNASTRFWGVSYIKGRAKYMAFVCYKGEVVSCGCFTDQIEAARARDYRAVQVLGEAAPLNFPEEWPAERRAEVYAQGESVRRELGRRAGRKVGRKEGKTGGRLGPRRTRHRARAVSDKSQATHGQGRDRASVKRQKARGRNGRHGPRCTKRDSGRGGPKGRGKRRKDTDSHGIPT